MWVIYIKTPKDYFLNTPISTVNRTKFERKNYQGKFVLKVEM